MSDDEVRTFRRTDLKLVGRAFLDGQLDYEAFRGRTLSVWDSLSRRALTPAESTGWSELVSALRQRTASKRAGAASEELFDDRYFRSLLRSLVEPGGEVAASSRVKRAKEIQASIASVLMEHWDPLGVRDIPEAEDEYHAYVGGLYRLLADGASSEEIARRLLQLETNLGVSPRPLNALLPVADLLLALDVVL